VSALIPPRLWNQLTTTVGLVCVRHDDGVNVMAAEWSYFVNRDPVYAAVVLAPGSVSRDLIEKAGEFSLTLCAENLASLADFAGSFSMADLDKTTSESLRLCPPSVTATPWAAGGVVALECVVRQVVPFPVHTMYAGEVVAAHLPRTPPAPLVKRGGMHRLGAPATRSAVVVAAQMHPGGILRVAASGPAGDAPWRVTLSSPEGDEVALGDHAGTRYGSDLLVDLRLPDGLFVTGRNGWRVRVARADATVGSALVGESSVPAVS
jgi:flavin reductase (DIM6/NTAB) family NADH-FMN oxidoreductase RutF